MSIKSFSKNTFIYSLGSIALRFTSFLLIPLYTNYLSISEFGLLQTLLLTVQIILTVNDVGMRSALMRFFSEYDKLNKLNMLLGSGISINVITGFFFILTSLLIPDKIFTSFFKIDEIPNILFYTVIVGVLQSLSLNVLSYFRAKDKGLTYMSISIITSLTLIFLTYIFLVYFDFGIVGVLWAQAITFGSMWTIILIWLLLKHGLTFNFGLFKTLLKFGSPLIFAMSGDLIVNTTGNYLLGHFRNLEEVAIFSLAFKIASISIMVLIGPFQMSYEPYIFNNKDNPRLKNIISKITTYIFLAYIITSYGILFVFRDLIDLIGNNQYSEAYSIIFYILPGIGFTALCYIGQSLLHIKNKTKITGLVYLATTIASIIVSYFAIQNYGIFGLVFSINFYLIASAIALFYLGQKEIKVSLEFGRILNLLVISIMLFSLIFYLNNFNAYIFYTISLIIPIIILGIYYKSNFFTLEEKQELKLLLTKIKSFVV